MPPEAPGTPDITVLLRAWAGGSQPARNELLPLVYNELKNVSRNVLRRETRAEVTATALVHELFVKLSACHSMAWNDRRHFFSFCAVAMRQILTDHARERLAQKRSATLVPLGHDEIPWIGSRPADYLDLDRALERLAASEPEKARVVELRVYLGCTAEETAELLGIAKPTVDRHMAFSRAWLYRALRREPEKSSAED